MLLNQIVSLYLVQEVTIYPPASVERFYIALFMYHSWELWLFGQRSKPTRSFVSIYTDIYIHRKTICCLDIEYLPLYQFVLTKHFFSVGTIKTLILVNETTVFLVRSHNVSGISNMLCFSFLLASGDWINSSALELNIPSLPDAWLQFSHLR